ncbi:hypothetical protein L596_009662 [Steinernema carpocapsae]|uniref:Uncharacterized protein n=1 Tax=Steinernema carpocapsae TaxID=34508 RepID=A0A4U5PG68_STECR|nr:hypothetical protein L596_009662 [Steinernema carpocapsae]
MPMSVKRIGAIADQRQRKRCRPESQNLDDAKSMTHVASSSTRMKASSDALRKAKNVVVESSGRASASCSPRLFISATAAAAEESSESPRPILFSVVLGEYRSRRKT